LLILFFVTILM